MINTTFRTSFFTSLLLVFIFNNLVAQVSVNEQEPNNTIATANYLGQDTIMNGAICPAGLNPDVDYYMIKLPTDGILKIKASVTQDTVTGRLVPLNFGLFNKQGQYINGYVMATDSPHSYASDSFTVSCLNADTFYIRVYDDAFTNDCHTYSFSYSVTAPVFPADTATQPKKAVFIQPITYQSAHNGYYASSEYDNFAIFKKDSFALEIYVKASTQTGDTTDRLQIFYADNIGNISGYLYAKVGVNNQIYSDSLTIPADMDTINYADTFQVFPNDTLSLRVNFTSGVCGSYQLYYGYPTGINQLSITNNQLKIYPNPTNGIVTLTINSSQKKPLNCDVFNVMGVDVYKSIIPLSGISSAQLNLSFLPKGMYFVKISDEQNSATKLLAIQ